MWALFTLTLTAGVVAAFNPCGFAMLPAYLGYFVSQESDDETNVGRNVIRGLMVGLTITAGFVLFFTVIGIITQTFVSQGTINQHMPKVTFAFGILLIPVGIAMAVFGWDPKLNIPRFQKGGKTRGFGSMFMFGISYAAVSLSCTAPVFFGTVIGSFTTEGFFNGLVAFVAYALGMGLVVMALTMATALARNELATFFRRALPWVGRVSGVLLFFAGIFLVFYGWWEIQVLRGNIESNWIVDQSERLQPTMTNWLADIGGLRMTIALLLLFALALTLAFRSSMGSAKVRAALGGIGVVWLLSEIFSPELFETRFRTFDRFEFIVRPFLRTVASIPERIGNWFTHTARWETVGEITFTVLLLTVVGLRLRHHLMNRSTDADEVGDADGLPVADAAPTAVV